MKYKQPKKNYLVVCYYYGGEDEDVDICNTEKEALELFEESKADGVETELYEANYKLIKKYKKGK